MIEAEFGDSFDRDQELSEIRAVEAAYDAAWQAGDIDGLLACLTREAVLVNPRGVGAKGHAEIRAELSKVMRGFAAGFTHSSGLRRIEFVTSLVAVVDGEAMNDVTHSNKPSARSLTPRFTDVSVKQSDKWKIAHIRAYVLMATEPFARDRIETI